MNKTVTETAVIINPTIVGAFSWTCNSMLKFTPSGALAEGTTYTINISTLAKDSSEGNNMQTPFASTFTTKVGSSSSSSTSTSLSASSSSLSESSSSVPVSSSSDSSSSNPALNIEMCPVPGQTYQVGKYEVTYQFWSTVYNWATTVGGYTFANPGVCGSTGAGSTSQPVTTVNWRDCLVWCNAVSEYEGLTPVYFTDSGYNTPIRVSTNDTTIDLTEGTQDNPFLNGSSTGYRLPTSNEWYIAARYPSTPDNYLSGASGDYTNDAASFAVGVFSCYHSGSSTGVTETANVGTKFANTIGSYDMSGNVLEWCFDWNQGYEGSYRVLRGGHWVNYSTVCRVGFVIDSSPLFSEEYLGFRFARSQ